MSQQLHQPPSVAPQSQTIPVFMRPYAATLLVGLAFAGFISLGLPDGLLGVGWPSIRQTFGLSLGALGPLLVTFSTGYLVSSAASGRVMARLGVGRLLAASGLATALSLLGYALSPSWWLMVAIGSLAGLGAGAIDAGLNTYVATQHSTRLLNWLHASFGLGAAIGPLVMTAMLQAGQSWRWGYAVVGLGQLCLTACFVATRTWWTTPGPAEQTLVPAPPAALRSTLRLPSVWLGILIFGIYTGLEITAGQWAYTLFTQRGIAPGTAGVWISIYWGGLMLGRIIFGAIVDRAPLRLLLRTMLGSIVLGALLIWLAGATLLSFAGLALMGLALAPIFPSLIATTPQRLGTAHAANGVGFQVAAAALGGAVLPSIAGLLAQIIGIEAVGPLLVASSLALALLYELLEHGGAA